MELESKIHSVKDYRSILEEIFGTRSYFMALLPSIRSIPLELKIANWEFYEDGCCLLKDNEEEMGLKWDGDSNEVEMGL